jgi:O-antigen ligase
MNTLIEFLFDYGRPLALATMGLAVIMHGLQKWPLKLSKIRGPSFQLLALNLFISTKLLIYGNYEFFFESVGIIFLTALAMIVVPSTLEETATGPNSVSVSRVAVIAWIFSTLLVVTNVFALVYFPYSSVNEVSRLHGVTVNPQHLAIMCALGSPAVIYAIHRGGLISVIGALSALILVGLIVLEFYTGSRLGFAAVFVGLGIVFREQLARPKVSAALFGAICTVAVFGWFYYTDIVDLIVSRFVDERVDTRSEIFTTAWQAFLENPIFGVNPDESTGRLAFVENFWLAAASTGGLVAVCFALLFFLGCAMTIRELGKVSRRRLASHYSAAMYRSAMVVLFALSMFEATLLGVLAAHTMISYMYLGAAANLILATLYSGRANTVQRFLMRGTYPRTRLNRW